MGIIKWIILMPLIWLMDYLYGIINPYFRESYLAVQEKLTEYMQKEQDRMVQETNSGNS